MFLLNGVFGKVKLIIMGLIAAALPILYLLGRRDGSQLEERKVLDDALKTEKKRSDFYKAMEQHDAEVQDATPRDRDELAKRLRQHGL